MNLIGLLIGDLFLAVWFLGLKRRPLPDRRRPFPYQIEVPE